MRLNRYIGTCVIKTIQMSCILLNVFIPNVEPNKKSIESNQTTSLSRNSDHDQNSTADTQLNVIPDLAPNEKSGESDIMLVNFGGSVHVQNNTTDKQHNTRPNFVLNEKIVHNQSTLGNVQQMHSLEIDRYGKQPAPGLILPPATKPENEVNSNSDVIGNISSTDIRPGTLHVHEMKHVDQHTQSELKQQTSEIITEPPGPLKHSSHDISNIDSLKHSNTDISNTEPLKHSNHNISNTDPLKHNSHDISNTNPLQHSNHDIPNTNSLQHSNTDISNISSSSSNHDFPNNDLSNHFNHGLPRPNLLNHSNRDSSNEDSSSWNLLDNFVMETHPTTINDSYDKYDVNVSKVPAVSNTDVDALNIDRNNMLVETQLEHTPSNPHDGTEQGQHDHGDESTTDQQDWKHPDILSSPFSKDAAMIEVDAVATSTNAASTVGSIVAADANGDGGVDDDDDDDDEGDGGVDDDDDHDDYDDDDDYNGRGGVVGDDNGTYVTNGVDNNDTHNNDAVVDGIPHIYEFCSARRQSLSYRRPSLEICEGFFVFSRNNRCVDTNKCSAELCGQPYPGDECSCHPDCIVYASCCDGFRRDCGYLERDSDVQVVGHDIKEYIECNPFVGSKVISTCPRLDETTRGFLDQKGHGYRRACESNLKPSSVLELFPVTDSVTGHHFKNFACWKCWEMSIEYEFWSVRFFFDRELKLAFDEQNFTTILETVVNNPKRALWDSPEGHHTHRCQACAVTTCTGCTDPYLEELCRSDHTPVTFNGLIYNNEHCLRCGIDKDVEESASNTCQKMKSASIIATSAPNNGVLYKVNISIDSTHGIIFRQAVDPKYPDRFLWSELTCPVIKFGVGTNTPQSQEIVESEGATVCIVSQCESLARLVEGKCQKVVPCSMKVKVCADRKTDEQVPDCRKENMQWVLNTTSRQILSDAMGKVERHLVDMKEDPEWGERELEVTRNGDDIISVNLEVKREGTPNLGPQNVCETKAPALVLDRSVEVLENVALGGHRIQLCATTFGGVGIFLTSARRCRDVFPRGEATAASLGVNEASNIAGPGPIHWYFGPIVFVTLDVAFLFL